MVPSIAHLSKRLPSAVAGLLAFAAVVAGCQPETLPSTKVSEAKDVEAVPDVTPVDAVAGDVAEVDQQAADVAEVAGPECVQDGDCAAKAGPCQLAACVKDKCALAQKPATAACDDGDPCTVGDACNSAGACVPGTLPPKCDDDNACTSDSCVPKTGCVHAKKSSGPCEDGDKCTDGDHCLDGICKSGANDLCPCHVDADCAPKANWCTGPLVCNKSGKVNKCEPSGAGVVCTDPNPLDCKGVVCDPAAPELAKACTETVLKDGANCNDGIDCTMNDKCAAGECKFDANLCDCLTTQQCVKKYNTPGNLCKNKHFCDVDHVCKPLPDVVCPAADLGACATVTCNEATGKCEPTPIKAQPLACDDGNACTEGDHCAYPVGGVYSGQCVSGKDLCLCTSNADCAVKEDGDMCNGTLYCDKLTGTCQVNPATVVQCPTANDTVCQKTVCNKKTGLCDEVPSEWLKENCPPGTAGCGVYIKLPEGATPVYKGCEDGNPCTASSTCLAGQCTTEPTSYICGCSKDSDCASLGDKCKGSFYCNVESGKCQLNPATAVVCPASADSQCAKNVCDPKTGACKPEPIAKGDAYVPCEDGNACTKFDWCDLQGQCQSGQNHCICQTDADCAAKEDGNPCNGTLYCNKAAGKCQLNPATVVYCSPLFDTACRANKCQIATGKCAMVSRSDKSLCDDGNVCTASDSCLAGVCVGGANLCECDSSNDCSKKEDGNLCNGTLFCDLAAVPHKCKVNPATVVTCPSGQNTACMLNTCTPATGACAMAPHPQLFAQCDDGNPCTAGDVCVAGVCTGSANLCKCVLDSECAPLDDGDPCNGKLYCDKSAPPFACKTLPGSPIVCSGSGECIQSTCSPSTGTCTTVAVPGACDDGNPCTFDACTGTCSHSVIDDGVTPCSPGSPDKVCVAGQCK